MSLSYCARGPPRLFPRLGDLQVALGPLVLAQNVVPPCLLGGGDVAGRLLPRALARDDVDADEPLAPAVLDGRRAPGAGHEDGRVGLGVGRGHHGDSVHPPVRADLPRGPEPLRARRHPPVDPCLVGVGDLPERRVVLDALLGPGIQHHLDLLLVDVAVDLVVGASVRVRRARAQMLADHVRPAVLIAPREPHEEPPFGHVVQGRRLLGDSDRVLRAHHVAQLPHADVLGDREPIGVEYAGTRPHLVAFRVEMMLDARNPPHAQRVRRPRQFERPLQRLVIPLDVPPDRSQRDPLLFALGADHRIELEDHLDHERRPSLCSRRHALPSIAHSPASWAPPPLGGLILAPDPPPAGAGPPSHSQLPGAAPG